MAQLNPTGPLIKLLPVSLLIYQPTQVKYPYAYINTAACLIAITCNRGIEQAHLNFNTCSSTRRATCTQLLPPEAEAEETQRDVPRARTNVDRRDVKGQQNAAVPGGAAPGRAGGRRRVRVPPAPAEAAQPAVVPQVQRPR
jgi:hypothetical protein